MKDLQASPLLDPVGSTLNLLRKGSFTLVNASVTQVSHEFFSVIPAHSDIIDYQNMTDDALTTLSKLQITEECVAKACSWSAVAGDSQLSLQLTALHALYGAATRVAGLEIFARAILRQDATPYEKKKSPRNLCRLL